MPLPRRTPSPTAAILFACALLLGPSNTAPAQSAATYHDRADRALESFLVRFWNGGAQYFRHTYPSDGALTHYWTYANAWNAVMDGVDRSRGQEFRGWIEALYRGQAARGWMSNYYDDECWMAIALIRAYDLTAEAEYLNMAEALYADIQTAWDTNCCGTLQGGLWWDKAHTQKATAANAGAALTGALLYQRNGQQTDLEFARMAFDFWYDNMVNPATGQVTDHFNAPSGDKVNWRFTYNEGLMIGAALELEAATGDSTYLQKAHRIAQFMVRYEITATQYGNALFDGANDGCGGDCHQFKGPAYRYLAQLTARDPKTVAYTRLMQGSADALWNLARDTSTDLFSVNWAGPPQTTVDLLQQNAACTALSLYAEHAGPFPGTGSPANQFEAEDATVYHIALETNYAGFSGWGYLAAWRGNNQWVKFRVVCTTPGQRIVTFRYAAGAGAASRLLRVNETNVVPNLTFPSTGAWSQYQTAETSLNLQAGVNTITLLYDQARGSSNWLNLDHLTISDLGPPQPLAITSITPLPQDRIRLTWTSLPGLAYQLQYKNHPADPQWSNLGAYIHASGPITTTEDTPGPHPQRFYRVLSR